MSETKRDFLTALEKSHGRQLRRYFCARMRNAAVDVPDLMQEVFLRLLHVDNHEAIRNRQAYLYTVANHVLYHYTLRRSQASQAFAPVDGVVELESIANADPATQLEFEQHFEAVGRALEQSSPKAYATLIMHRCDGVPLREIGGRLGVSYSMVKRYLAKATAFCQQRLGDIPAEKSRAR